MRYRKKHEAIEAVQYDGTFPLDFLREGEEVSKAPEGDGLLIHVPQDVTVQADVGDWIIRHHGALWRCKPDVFAATYEPVTADA